MPESSPRENGEESYIEKNVTQKSPNLRTLSLRRRLGLLLILLGIGVLSIPLITYVQGQQSQQELEEQWEKAVFDDNVPDESEPNLQTQTSASKPIVPPKGFPVTRLLIPKIGLDAIVVEGVTSSALRRGPGHFPGTAMPGMTGNCCIAGHRNMYGNWFMQLDLLTPGDDIILNTPDGEYEYLVKEKFTVEPSNMQVLSSKAGRSLTLITCTPVPRPTHRLIVRAEME